MNWSDTRRVLHLDLAKGSRMLPPLRREIIVKSGDATRSVVFSGQPLEVKI